MALTLSSLFSIMFSLNMMHLRRLGLRPRASAVFRFVARAISDLKSKEAENALVAYYSSHHVVTLAKNHRFPMHKYQDVVDILRNDESLKGKIELRLAPPCSIRDLELAHCPSYIRRFLDNQMTSTEMRYVGFPWSHSLVDRTLASAGGTVEACRLLLKEGRKISANVAGGTHHAFRDRGEGFCVFNDLAISALWRSR